MNFVTIPRNELGRDFVIGDIHGEFKRVRKLLERVWFNPAKDRLFAVGDLVDRGADSEQVLEWLAYPWFYSIAGNHETMTIDAGSGRPQDMIFHSSNGGAWFARMAPEWQKDYVEAFKKLPIAMEVPVGDKLCGIIHAEPFHHDWNKLRQTLSGDPSVPPMQVVTAINYALWARDRIRAQDPVKVENVDVVFVGHTPVKTTTWQANVFYIDTGGCFGRPLTMVQMDTMEEFQHINGS